MPAVVSVPLRELLAVERIETSLYRSLPVVDPVPPLHDRVPPLYGGQVAAQALYAAGQTVPEGRVAHSLHGYFLRGGSAATPTVFRVEQDRDGRTYSARRVVAIQGGKEIFTMSASFTLPEAGTDLEHDPMPDVPGPQDSPEADLRWLPSVSVRVPPQANAGADPGAPSRFWARDPAELPDSPLMHACVLTYVSDASTGLAGLPGGQRPGSSLDHAVWFHRPARLDDWVLMDLVPRTIAAGRGWYTGTVRTPDGARVASLAQEMLFRTPRRGG